MPTSALRNLATPGLHGAPLRIAAPPAAQRTALLVACVAAFGVAAWAGGAAGTIDADADLTRLLRGIALIKASLVIAAIGVLWWRLGRPVAARTATAYVVGAALMAGATALVWMLASIPLAALLFHIGEFTLLIVAWRDRSGSSDPRATLERA